MNRLLLALLVLGIFSPTLAEQIIRVSTEEYPPYTSQYIQHGGIANHVLSEALELEGIIVEYTYYPGNRSYKMALDGVTVGTVPWVYRVSRTENFYYGEALVKGGYDVFFFHKDQPLPWDPEKQDYRTLANIPIAGVLGYDYGEHFQHAEQQGTINVHRVSTAETAFKMLLAGRVQAVLLENRPGYYQLHSHFDSLDVAHVETVRKQAGDNHDTYMLISKKNTKAQLILEKMNNGIIKLKESGRYAQLIEALERGEYVDQRSGAQP